MHKVTLKYIDFFDENKESVEDLYFNINAFELAEIMVEFPEGGLGEYMRAAIKEGRNKDAFAVLKMLFVKGYGRRQEIDGRVRFIKKPEWILELIPSPEFESFYLKLADDTKFAIEFWNGLVSPELLKRAEAVLAVENVQPQVSTSGTKFRDLPLEEQVALLREKAAANNISLDD